MPAILGSVVSMGVTILWAKMFHKDKAKEDAEKVSLKEGIMAWLPLY